jgi:hypothetical protein
MANRFWVGGSGTWDSTTTTNWSATTGGAGGASVPTNADTVIFDASSGTGTVTISTGGGATCLTLTASAITANLKFDGRTASGGVNNPVTITTNATFAVAATFVNYPLDIQFTGSVTTSILNNASTTVLGTITNGKSAGTLSIATSNCVCDTFIQSGNITALTTNLTCNTFQSLIGAFQINAAILTVSTSFSDDDAANSRSIIITTGTLNVGTNVTTTSLTAITYYLNNSFTTFTPGTGVVVIGSTTPQATNATFFHGCSGNLRNVLFQGTKTFIYGGNSGVSLTVAGATTAGFRVTSPAGINHEMRIDSRISITVTGGTFSVVGNSVTNRALVCNDQMGTASSIVLTGTATRTLTNVDLQDIAFTFGSALTGTSIGDCGNITNVTPTAAVTCFAKTGATAFNYDGAMWFTTSGGVTAQRVPLPQDTVIFDSNTGSGVVTVNARTLGGAITTTGWGGSFDINLLSDCIPSIYGQYTGTGSLLNTLTRVRFGARADTTVPATGITGTMLIDCIGFTATLSGAINNADLILWLHSGTLNTSVSNYAITASNLYLLGAVSGGYVGSPVGGNAALTLNASTVTLTAKTAANVINIETAATLTAGTSTVNITPQGSLSAINFISAKTFNNVTLTPNSSLTTFNKTGNTTFAAFTCSTIYPFAFTFAASSTNTFTTLSLTGTTSGGIVVRPAVTAAGTTATLAIGSASITSYTAFRQITKSGASTLTANNVADLGANSGITFSAITKTFAFTSGAGSFDVPSSYNGSNMFYVVGAGGGSGRRVLGSTTGGGGGAAVGISSNLSLTKNQTVYYSVGSAGAGVTSGTGNGGTGGTSWVNSSANAQPATANIGAIANGGVGSTTAGVAGTGGTANTTVNTVGVAGGAGASGGGGTAAGFAYGLGRTGGTANGGGAGMATAGVNGATNGGAGGSGIGAGGTGGTPSVLNGGAGGIGAGGGGGVTAQAGNNAGNAGAGGAGSDFSYSYLNGSIASGSIGPGGAGGGGGSTTFTSGLGGSGGAGSYGAGGGRAGAGGSLGSNGLGASGGGGLIIFVYEMTRAANFGTIIG